MLKAKKVYFVSLDVCCVMILKVDRKMSKTNE